MPDATIENMSRRNEPTTLPSRGRVFYYAGPGDVLGSYRHWRDRVDDPNEVSITYSSQFFDQCRRHRLDTWVVASHPTVGCIEDGATRVEHRPFPASRGSFGWYWSRHRYSLHLVCLAIRFRADVMVVSTGFVWPWALWARACGIEIVPSMHCALWPDAFASTKVHERLQRIVDGWFWRHVPTATICVSPTCERQARDSAGSATGTFHQARVQYRRETFDALPAARWPRDDAFVAFFAGRIERDKGVYDLLESASRLDAAHPGRFVFELAGSGSELGALRKAAVHAGLGDRFRVLGKLDREQMQAAFGRSHAVIVPTTTDFAEGLNRVAVEGTLAGRPVITSGLSNALDVLGDSIYEVRPNSVSDFCDALTALANDRTLYERKRAACSAAREPFFDRDNAWGTQLGHVFARCFGPVDKDCDADDEVSRFAAHNPHSAPTQEATLIRTPGT